MYYDTLIRTKQGVSKVKDLKIGDLVYTENGIQPIRDIQVYTFEQCMEIEFEDRKRVVCQWDQSFLSNGKWIQAKDIWIRQDIDDFPISAIIDGEEKDLYINKISLFTDCGGVNIFVENADAVLLENGVITRYSNDQEEDDGN